MIKTIYVDMDGVIADFDAGVREYTGHTIEQLTEMGAWDQVKYRLKHVPFFSELRPMNLIHVLQAHPGKFEILSAVGKYNSDFVTQQKVDWLIQYLGEDVKCNFVIRSKHKAKFAAPDTILIDDREKSLVPFAQAGGRVLHYKNCLSQDELINQMLEGLK